MKHLSDYIRKQAFKISALEERAGIPRGTLQNHFGKPNRSVSDSNWADVLRALCPVIINGFRFRFDEEHHLFFVEWDAFKSADEIVITEPRPGTYVYHVPTLKDMICDNEYWDLKPYLCSEEEYQELLNSVSPKPK